MTGAVVAAGSGVIDWVRQRLGLRDFGPATGLGVYRNGKICAGVLYNGYTVGNIHMHVASDGSRRWGTRDYLWMCFHYPFEQLGCRRVTAPVYDGNLASQRFVEHLGFTLETRLEDAAPHGDILIYRMWKRDCRFLTMRRARYEPRSAEPARLYATGTADC